jgi:PilZ domain-containing protein
MSERRRSSRQKAFLKGRIFFNNRRNSIDCLIRDISEQGAKLLFSASVATPDVVELHVPSRDECYRARIEWRTAEEVGVSFEGGEVASPPLAPGASVPGDWSSRIHRLEREVASLQRKVTELQSALRLNQGTDL